MRCATRTPHERPRTRAWIGVLGAVALLGGLLAPLPAAHGSDWALSTRAPADGDVAVDGTRLALDTPLRWQSAEATETGPLPEEYVDGAMEAIGAVGAWDAGQRGSGALVAVIDTGVEPVGALDGAVAGEIDFTGEGGGDGYGHGTYMASLIAARSDQAPGVAPEAGVLSLKVADADGMTDLRTVLGALQWLQGPGRALGVRVATLALGVDPDTPEGALLDAATARLAATGVLVVTASGNDADEQALASPATAPGSLSVGALDGDEVAAFSGAGTDRAGVAQPDVLAPGVGVVGHAPVGSAISDEAAAEGADPERLADGHLRGNGTSVSAALAAGVAALASSANPDLDGAELAEALGDGGEGLRLDAGEAIAAASAARTSRPVAERLPNGKRRPVHPRTPPAELPLPPVADWTAAEWNDTAWTTAEWAADRWDASSWAAFHPTGTQWAGSDWDSADWEAAAWDGTGWVADGWPALRRQLSRIGLVRSDGEEWTLTAGDGEPWQLVVKWNVVRWNVVRWNVVRWNVVRWNAAEWTADVWNVVKWNGGRTVGTPRGVVKWNGDAWSVVKWNGSRSPRMTPDVVKWNGEPTSPARQ